MSNTTASMTKPDAALERKVADLLARMTLAEKIGQMSQLNVGDGCIHDPLAEAVRAGRVGSVLNEVNVEVVNELQRLAMEESRLGIPLLVARDVIHGFQTVMPIPFAQAASWSEETVRLGARVAAREAARCGVNWTFAPMIDVARDPRWGRIAESLGEDPYLISMLGAAMVRGFQGDELAAIGSVAACAKHFAGYGAVESGRDYAATNIPENEMRNVYLRPFKAAVDAGVATLMTSFSDIDGVPATANEFLLRDILRDEWAFDGLVVSDWDSIRQLCIHGLTETDEDAALEAARAGVDMEMHGDAYINNLERHVNEGRVDPALIDTAASNILRIKFRLGLFDNPYTDPSRFPPIGDADALGTAHRAALQSVVLLKNAQNVLPLSVEKSASIAVIGPLADEPREQLGTWIFDGNPELSVTPLRALREFVGDKGAVRYARGLETSRSRDASGFAAAETTARNADTVVLFLGEEAILSGEAHSRADIGLPGAQAELVRRIHSTGKPIIAVILTGRPLVLTDIVEHVDAILFAGHLGTMAGPALVDLLFGTESPSGKLPATLPKMVGQIPIYYSQKNTGKPPSPDTAVLIDEIDAHAEQLSTGLTAYHLDAGYRPLFPFGYGLSYTSFHYEKLRISAPEIALGQSVSIRVDLINAGDRDGTEVVQLYVRDLVGSVTRPVRELKAFRRVFLEGGARKTVEFVLPTDDLAFFGRDNSLRAEPGKFQAWVGGSSETDRELTVCFRIVNDP
ncbi:MAG: glycoside hydrolase family 3 N-terminal domain-containing protein [Pseudomonadota bacterium]